jgi:hypothetical protein
LSSSSERLVAVRGSIESPTRFSGRPALRVKGKEIIHCDSRHRLDDRLTRRVIRRRRQHLRSDRSVRLLVLAAGADWI